MSKISRDALKEIVKECLVELLAEGLGAANVAAVTESVSRRPASPAPVVSRSLKSVVPTSRRPGLDAVRHGTAPARVNTTQHQVKALTDDPIMTSILSDTASTTMREQVAAERGQVVAGGDAASMLMSQVEDPTEIFTEAADKWSFLAFGKTPPAETQ